MSRIFKITEKIEGILYKSRIFTIKTRDFLLNSLKGTIEYSVSVVPKGNIKTSGILPFDNIPLRRIGIISSPGFTENRRSVLRVQKGYAIDPGKLEDSADEFLFSFEIEYEVDQVVKDLIRKDHQIETAGDEGDVYWLHAQIKRIQDFERILRKVDLVDIPFAINVAIHQDIKTKFPRRRQQELELITKWVREHDRERKKILSHDHLKHKRRRPREKEITQVLRDLQILFMPQRFKSFVEIVQDFYYYDCFRGTDFYDQIPFRTFPKWMTVISRTDLSLKKPAAEGELLYKKEDFRDAVEKAITKK